MASPEHRPIRELRVLVDQAEAKLAGLAEDLYALGDKPDGENTEAGIRSALRRYPTTTHANCFKRLLWIRQKYQALEERMPALAFTELGDLQRKGIEEMLQDMQILPPTSRKQDMQSEYNFAQFLELDDAAKAILVDGIAEIKAIVPANTVAAAVAAAITSELDPLPRTTFTELKARSAWMVTKNALLVAERKSVGNAGTFNADVDALKADLRKLGVNFGVVAGALNG